MAKGEKLKRYLQRVWEKSDHFQYFHIRQIPKKDNWKVDKLA